jgi:uncharacterized protein
MNIREFSQSLQNIYDDMGQTFSTFQKASGLNCLEGCGRCCKNPEVEASPLEMFPLALRLWDEGKLEFWLDKLENPAQDHCLMFNPDPTDANKGQCSVYNERPTVCRMFGVAGHFNKYREITLSVCKYIRETYPELTAIRESEAGEETPMLANWGYRLVQLDPELIQNRMPLNLALKNALERVALYAQYQEHS